MFNYILLYYLYKFWKTFNIIKKYYLFTFIYIKVSFYSLLKLYYIVFNLNII